MRPPSKISCLTLTVALFDVNCPLEFPCCCWPWLFEKLLALLRVLSADTPMFGNSPLSASPLAAPAETSCARAIASSGDWASAIFSASRSDSVDGDGELDADIGAAGGAVCCTITGEGLGEGCAA